MSLNIMCDEFNSTYRVKYEAVSVKSIDTSCNLIMDEVHETVGEAYLALGNINVPNVAKEMADIIYITAQRMRTFGFDIDSILKEVHRSNMSKTVTHREAVGELLEARKRYPSAYVQEGQQYSVLRCMDTNKVIKSTTYSPAVITQEMI